MSRAALSLIYSLALYLSLSLFVLANSNTLVGSIPGQFNVGSTGAAEYSIPIEIPPGTAGVQPQLSLNYNSQGGNGLLGVGWSLGGLSVIHRCPANKAKDGFIDGIDFDSNDRFCLDGQPLVAISGAYGAHNTEYRTEIDGYSKIVSHDADGVNGVDSFTVYTKSGDVMEYGVTADSYINPPLANGTVQLEALCWLLNKVTDSVGNYMTVTYFEDETTGENYPLRIDYTGNSTQSLAPYNSVEFEYESRTDESLSYVSGKKINSTKRLKKIIIKASSLLVREYLTLYQYTQGIGRSQLIKVDLCDVTGTCVNATEFENYDSADGTFQLAISNAPYTIGGFSTYANAITGDFNGDGLIDFAWTNKGIGGSKAYIALSNGDGTVQSAISSLLTSLNVDSYSHAIPGDFNGDGLTDLALTRKFNNGLRAYISLSNGDGTFQSAISNAPNTTGNFDSYAGAITGDFNGDGLTDLAWSRKFNNGLRAYISLSNGDGTFQSAISNAPNTTGNFDSYASAITGDFNGDGLTDLAWTYKGTNGLRAYISLSNGDGTVQSAISNAPNTTGNFSSYASAITGDFNGDGLTDLAWTYNGSSVGLRAYISLSNGDGTVQSAISNAPNTTGNFSSYASAITGDFNGDGLTDLAWTYKGTNGLRAYISLSNDDGTVQSAIYNGPNSSSNFGAYANAIPGDFNGDGLTDLAWTYKGTNGLRAYPSLADKNGGNGSVNIKAITNGLGISIDIDYKPLTDSSVYTKGVSASFPEQDLQNAMYVVSQSRTDNGVGSQNTLNYTYAGAKVDLSGRGFLGFASRTVEDASTGTIVTTNFRQDFPFTGVVSSTETHHGATLLSREANTHASTVTGTSTETGSTDPVFIYTSQSVAESFDLDTGALITTTTTTSTYDSYGNPTQIIATTNDVGEPSFVTTTNNTYTNDTTKWHLGRLTAANVTKSLGGVASPTRSSSFEYDAVTGLLTKEIIEPGSSMELMKTYTHDGFGNRLSVATSGSNITTRTTSTTYDAQGRFALTATNALSHSETREYDPLLNQGWGQVTKLTGPNGLSTAWEYDTLGRKIKETRADGTQTTISYAFCDGSNPCPTLANTLTPSYVMTTTTDGAPLTKTYYDAVNRAVLTETESFDGSLVSQQTEYDARARVARTSLPYSSTAPLSSGRWTVNTYDSLDRLIQEYSPVTGTTNYAFNGLETTVTNDLSQDMKEKKNSRGQTLWSDDEQGNRVSFTYDAAGNLTQVSDGANVTINTYDLRGFKETMDDPDMGQWGYTYNVLGELISQTNANSQTTTMTYDLLGRLKTRTEPEGITTWNYDSATKGIGKLASVVHYGGYSRTESYDSLGRPSSSSTTINGAVYATSTTYDSVGRVDELTYPGGFKVKHNYTALGYLEKVVNATTPTTEYWQAYGMDVFGNVTSAVVGGIHTEKIYSNNTGRLESISAGFTTVQNLTYTYDSIGNLTQRKDDLQSKTENFLYDNLNRLTSATVVGVGTKTFTYDAMGNITNKSDVGNYLYGNNAGPHAVTSTTGLVNATYTYDNNGNMLTQEDNGTVIKSMIWSSYNKPIQITKGQGQAQKIVSFNYGPDRTRYQQVASDSSTVKTTTYIGSLYEKVQTGSNIDHKHYIRAGGQVIAIHNTYNYQSDQTQFLHRDHLGSVDVITDANQNVTERLSFDAFGQRREVNWNDAISQITSSITRGYTGHEQLDSVGLIHMNGRVYDPQLGRFLSADPFVQQPKNYQSLNRYTYVQNNPLSYTDPSGFFFKKVAKAFKKAVKSVAKAVSSIVSGAARIVAGAAFNLAGSALNAINSNAITATIAQAVACTNQATCVAYTVASTYAATGSLTASLKAGAISFGTIEISKYIKTNFDGRFAKAVAHGAVGGTTAELQGGKFGSGFAGSFVAKLGSGTIADRFGIKTFSDRVSGAVVAASLAGTASVLTGGKFVNGAKTAAIQFLYNEALYFEESSGLRNAIINFKNSFLRLVGHEDTIVIGEDMGRVVPHADKNNMDYYGGLNREASDPEYMVDNIAFINEKMDQGYTIYDIGPSPDYKNYPSITSPFYNAEIRHIFNRNGASVPYEHYEIDRDNFNRWLDSLNP